MKPQHNMWVSLMWSKISTMTLPTSKSNRMLDCWPILLKTLLLIQSAPVIYDNHNWFTNINEERRSWGGSMDRKDWKFSDVSHRIRILLRNVWRQNGHVSNHHASSSFNLAILKLMACFHEGQTSTKTRDYSLRSNTDILVQGLINSKTKIHWTIFKNEWIIPAIQNNVCNLSIWLTIW